MISIGRILCPVDFSEFSRHAVRYAARLAEWYESEVDLVHVFASIAPPAVMAEYPSTVSLTTVDRQHLVDEVQRMAQPLADAGVNFTTTVEDGDTVERILHHAKTRNCDLIVMGTHGSGGFERLLLGSISEKVLRKAPCPVLTIPPHDATEPAPKTIVFKNILCPVDFSTPSMHALTQALSLAEEADGKLTAVHVLEWFTDPEPREYEQTSVPEYRRLVESDARARLAKAIPDEARQWCEADEVLTSGSPHREILRLAEAQSADVIVMGIHGRGAVDLMVFGSVTNHVVRAATCPVLTVPTAES
jgi:nucleotide-binding universal stress UspA family protein